MELWKYNVAGSGTDQVILIQSGVQVDSFVGSDSVSTDIHRYCIQKGNYELQLKKLYGYGWTSGSAVEIYLFDVNDERVFIGRKTLRDLPRNWFPSLLHSFFLITLEIGTCLQVKASPNRTG